MEAPVSLREGDQKFLGVFFVMKSSFWPASQSEMLLLGDALSSLRSLNYQPLLSSFLMQSRFILKEMSIDLARQMLVTLCAASS